MGVGDVNGVIAPVVDVGAVAGEDAAVEVQRQVRGYAHQQHSGAVAGEGVVEETVVGCGLAGAVVEEAHLVVGKGALGNVHPGASLGQKAVFVPGKGAADGPRLAGGGDAGAADAGGGEGDGLDACVGLHAGVLDGALELGQEADAVFRDANERRGDDLGVRKER